MTQQGLFSNAGARRTDDLSPRVASSTTGAADRHAAIRQSSLWAAYGDALGWISELTDEAGLDRRTAGAPLHRPVGWMRRIGGRAGVTIRLPQGCYSDDSQLRLATSRAIRPDGFDVEAFAKVELPVWLSYALGGGKSTSAAAENLTRPRVSWFANTFKGWTESGGNGAAMRIQPHVWAAASPGDAESFLPDVVRNAVCSHSHPVGLMGAVFHALTLAHVMTAGDLPSPDELMDATGTAANLPDMLREDVEVGTHWRTVFERAAGSFAAAWARTVDECREAIRIAAEDGPGANGEDRYAGIVDRLRLREPARRGSGLLTAVAAAGLTWCTPRPEEALCIAANAIGTDTDTIATMAGAILGVTADAEPPVEVLDADLFRSEADRLAEIAQGRPVPSHRYPDLLHWSAPKKRADALVLSGDENLRIRGLGRAKAADEPIAPPKGDFCWQWLRLEETGQTLLIKRRKRLAREEETPGASHTSSRDHTSPAERKPVVQPTEDECAAGAAARGTAREDSPEDAPEWSRSALDLQRALKFVEKHKDDDRKIGQALRRVVKKGTRGETAAFAARLIDLLR